jgi:hypothetical protein
MVKKLLLLPCLLFALTPIYGQDLITRQDGVVIKATVLERQPSLIRFKLFGQQDTLVYQISTQDVRELRMADGSTKSLPPSVTDPKAGARFDYVAHSGRNILWFSPFDWIYSKFTLAYERISSSGLVGFKIPLVLGLSSSANPYYANSNLKENTRFGAGLEVNYYLFGQGKVQYYLGPALHLHAYKSYYYPGYYPGTPDPQRLNVTMMAVALQNGAYYQFSRFFNVAATIGLGYRYFLFPDTPTNYYDPGTRNRAYVPGNLHFGFRF